MNLNSLVHISYLSQGSEISLKTFGKWLMSRRKYSVGFILLETCHVKRGKVHHKRPKDAQFLEQGLFKNLFFLSRLYKIHTHTYVHVCLNILLINCKIFLLSNFCLL